MTMRSELSRLARAITSGELSVRLERWSVVNAWLLLLGVIDAVVTASLKLQTLILVGSFVGLIGVCRGHWTPRRVFGVANVVTAIRLALVVVSAWWLDYGSPGQFAGLAAAVVALDLVDGMLARRFGLASPFGAHFDMETDAAFSLIMTEVLWLRHYCGSWILAIGVLRPLYVLWKVRWARQVPPMPRSMFGRLAFGVFACAITGAFVLPDYASLTVLCVGAMLVFTSFARSFWWTWHCSRKSPAA